MDIYSLAYAYAQSKMDNPDKLAT